MEDTEARTITFLFCLDDGYWSDNVSTAYVRGSFNNWKDVDYCKMSYDKESNCWYVTLTYEQVNIPGNSGSPNTSLSSTATTRGHPAGLPTAMCL